MRLIKEGSDQVSLKQVCSATETGNIFYRELITKAWIRVCGCAGWSAPLLFAYNEVRFSHDKAHIMHKQQQDQHNLCAQQRL